MAHGRLATAFMFSHEGSEINKRRERENEKSCR
jgi:hypothetical protein